MKKKTTLEEQVAEAEKNLRDAAIETATNIAQSIIYSDALKNIEIPKYDDLGRRNCWVLGADMALPNLNKVAATVKAEDEEPEEWIWVEGYKGTDKDMKCRDFQFELNKEFYHEGDVNICRSGFHFCKKLEQVFGYYGVCDGHRFFKVKALVNKKKYEEANNKYTSKAIIFTEELNREEIFTVLVEKYPDLKGLPVKYFDTLFNSNKYKALNEWQIDTLVLDGYSPELAEYFVNSLGAFGIAHIFSSQPGLSIDAKVIAITNIICTSNSRTSRLF